MLKQCRECTNNIAIGSKSGLCRSCSTKGERNHNYKRIFSVEHRKKLSEKGKGRICTLEAIEKMRNKTSGKNHWSYGKTFSEEHRKKLSNSRKGKNGPMLGKYHTSEAKRKMRLARLNQISKNEFNGYQVIPNFNLAACQKIDEYGKQNGYSFQHAMNGGEYYIKELGYFVDGYDKEKNTVVEYYEKKHENRVQKDLNRETEICNHLGCDFIILWE